MINSTQWFIYYFLVSYHVLNITWESFHPITDGKEEEHGGVPQATLD